MTTMTYTHAVYNVCMYRYNMALYMCLLREKSRSLVSANDAKTGEQSVFSEFHTIHPFGTPHLDSQTRYVAASSAIDTQNDYRNPACMRQGLMRLLMEIVMLYDANVVCTL